MMVRANSRMFAEADLARISRPDHHISEAAEIVGTPGSSIPSNSHLLQHGPDLRCGLSSPATQYPDAVCECGKHDPQSL
jgi:hypothetical protein